MGGCQRLKDLCKWLRILFTTTRFDPEEEVPQVTECTKSATNLQLRFDFELGKSLVGSFDGGKISSDGGLVLLRQMDDVLQLTARMSEVLTDSRKQSLVRHELSTMIQQRVFAIASGYEDVNDAAQLRFDPMHKM